MSASAETKDPSGGTTGRVKLSGRLGWIGARASYSLGGEGLPLPPVLCRGRVVARSKDQAIFFSSFGVLGRIIAPPAASVRRWPTCRTHAAAGWFKALL